VRSTPAPFLTRHAPALSTVARLVLAAVLLVAGGLKVADPRAAVQAVRAYQLLPESLEVGVGWALPFLEIALGLLLAVGLCTRAAAAATAVLLLAFVAAIGSAAARGLSIDCGCFGGGGTVAPGETRYGSEIARDVALLALAGWLVRHPRSRLSLDPTPVPTSTADEQEHAR
jgi:uncharacterized membrane protein YphA (DoxX/SURF4 family)